MNWSICLIIAVFIWNVDCQTRPVRKYKVKENPSGAKPQSGDRVIVHYTGNLKGVNNTIGTKFDSSRDRNDPFRFTLFKGEVISGWDIAVNSMRVGDRAWFDIPSDLAYGPNGSPPAIPRNADLLFDIELLGIEPRPAPNQASAQNGLL
ncbi:peptidyl-prolyl cis-trans isomerase Fkbp12-like [Ruditapes philippinarum]|uniref:peptidyl-prolyl cis-trans isomerase Fkbp12-like n=1 Tax=Ruditapes philippinarum TaxID=129788 RepID=UPI00295ABE66|nr:peptidyl-prolyl cis-trans isomerase Fkbp12-like [Ruditapes philippinarum]